MLLVSEYRIEEGDDFRVTISRNWRRIRVSRIRFWWVIDASEWIIIHVIEALMVPPNPSVEYCNNRAGSI